MFLSKPFLVFFVPVIRQHVLISMNVLKETVPYDYVFVGDCHSIFDLKPDYEKIVVSNALLSFPFNPQDIDILVKFRQWCGFRCVWDILMHYVDHHQENVIVESRDGISVYSRSYFVDAFSRVLRQHLKYMSAAKLIQRAWWKHRMRREVLHIGLVFNRFGIPNELISLCFKNRKGIMTVV